MGTAMHVMLGLLSLSASGYALYLTDDALASEDVCSVGAGASCALNELQAAARIGSSIDKEDPATACTPESKSECECAILEIPKKHPLPIIPGTKDNLHGMPADLDLTGVWWIYWELDNANVAGNPSWWDKLVSTAMAFQYKTFMQFEQIVSWAETNSTSTSYPTNLTMPVATKYHWAYGTNFGSRMYMTYIHWDYGSIQWTMYNSSYGVSSGASTEHALTDGYQFIATDDPDKWYRPTCPYGKQLCVTYSLVRIQNEAGSKTKFWDVYEKTAPEKNTIYTTDDYCRRRAMGIASTILWLLPLESLCKPVNYLCDNSATFRSIFG